MKKDLNKRRHLILKGEKLDEDLLPEYDFQGAKPNPYAGKDRVFVELSPDVSKVFKSAKDVNKTLRAIIATHPKRKKIIV